MKNSNKNKKSNDIIEDIVEISNYLKRESQNNKLANNKTKVIRKATKNVKKETAKSKSVKKAKQAEKKEKRFSIKILIGSFSTLIIIVIVSILLNSVLKTIYPKISEVNLTNYNSENNKINIEIKVTDGLLYKNVFCYIGDLNKENEKYALVEENKCEFEVEAIDHIISIGRKNTVIEQYKLSDKIASTLEIKANDEKIYLAINGTYKASVSVVSIGQPSTITWEVENEEIANVKDDGVVTGKSEGTTKVIAKDKYGNEASIDVVVTKIITKPTLNNSKSFLPCNRYTKSQAQLLDTILFSRIESAGKKTRAGVVAAARFLSLEFPYKIGYFLETGRLNPTSGGYVDGEGRFYHEGLYLSTDKYSIIKSSFSGPAIWGCKMMEYGDIEVYRPNGLDCSGFVAWAQKNGGFDFGDLGSIGWDGQDPYVNDLTSFGDFQVITMDLLKSGKIKAGDLASTPGHIAIIIGIDDEHIYVAEEYFHSQGLTVLTFTHDELIEKKYFTHFVLMDKAYKEDGNYTAMWE